MRMRKKPNLIPRMERCADYLVTDPQQWRGRWREKGTPGCELRLELGCGKGRFTCETAAAEPDVLFVAVERVPDAMVIAMERAKAAGLNNVFFIDADVARLTEFFAPGEVERIYLNFCDPWPTNRHAKRRLALGEVTRDLHENGICGVMTDYEEKFHNLGTPINRCVGTKGELPPEESAAEPEK